MIEFINYYFVFLNDDDDLIKKNQIKLNTF